MARHYTQIMCAIWDDEEFLALSELAQRAYFMLCSQKDISAAGVVRIWTPRWAALSRTSTDESLKAALSELKTAKYIVPDWVTGELLVRSFVRWDGGFKNSKRLPLILREAQAVTSMEIKACLRAEFERLGLDTSGLPTPPPTGSDSPSDGLSDGLSGSNGMGGDRASASNRVSVGASAAGTSASSATATGKPTFAHVDSPSDGPSDTAPDTTVLFEGVVVTYLSRGEPTTPQSVPPPADADASGTQLAIIQGGVDPVPTDTAQTATAAWCDAFAEHHDAKPTRQQRGQAAHEARALIEAGNPPDRVVLAARSAGARGFATVQREYRDLAQRRDVAQPATHAAHVRPSITDARVNAGLALAEKYARQEASG